MRHPNPYMLLRMAQADSYAMAVEYVSRIEHPEHYQEVLRFEKYGQHPLFTLRPGQYTDDTQMSIAVSETLLAGGSAEGQSYADAFYRVFKRDPRDGYSRALQAILEASTSTEDMLQRIVPESNKNGAAMRSVPLGVISDRALMLVEAETQAKVTHNTPGGIQSSQMVAMMSHFALHESGGFEEMHAWCRKRYPAFALFDKPWTGGVGLKGTDPNNLGIGMCTAWAVSTLLREQGSLMGILRQVIEWRGDTDSVAAIAWGIASSRYQDEVVPDFLTNDLEPNGSYGATFLVNLGSRLMRAFNPERNMW